MIRTLQTLLAAVGFAAIALPASAGFGSTMPDTIELKKLPPTFPCGVRPCGPTGPKCLAKPCGPGPIGWPPGPRKPL